MTPCPLAAFHETRHGAGGFFLRPHCAAVLLAPMWDADAHPPIGRVFAPRDPGAARRVSMALDAMASAQYAVSCAQDLYNLWSLPRALRTVHCALCTVHCALRTAHCALLITAAPYQRAKTDVLHRL